MTAPELPIRFTKMSGAGNDFIVIEAEEAARLNLEIEDWVRLVCRRGLSVGADGVIVLRPVPSDSVEMLFRNPDGSVAFCGNGSRCAARYAYAKGWCGDRMTLLTAVGAVAADVASDSVRITLPAPEDRGRIEVEVHGRSFTGRHVVAGVPHFVVPVADLATMPVREHGEVLRKHPRFGDDGVNVDFVSWRRDGSLGIRTYERGVEGETLSCGSGAVAAAFAAHADGAGGIVRVVPWSGIPLRVAFPGPDDAPFAALLEGDARFVFEGTLFAEGVTGFGAR
jgi:diaminopimelate epimerase